MLPDAPQEQEKKEVDGRSGTWFKKGQSGNPGGRPKGLRDSVQRNFLKALDDDFKAHGKQAIVDCREKKPDVYVKVIASLLPKEIDIKRPLEELSDDAIADAIATLQSAILAHRVTERAGDAGEAPSVN
jgi:hypothetical protein